MVCLVSPLFRKIAKFRRLVVNFVQVMEKNQSTSTKYQLNPKFKYSNDQKILNSNVLTCLEF